MSRLRRIEIVHPETGEIRAFRSFESEGRTSGELAAIVLGADAGQLRAPDGSLLDPDEPLRVSDGALFEAVRVGEGV